MKNSNRQKELSMHRHLNVIGGFSLAILLTSVSLAQTAPPSGIVLPQGGAPAVLAPLQVQNAAPVPEIPAGGFAVTPPAMEGEDPANRMNLDGSEEYLDTIQSGSDDRLSDLTGASVSPETASDLEQMQTARRNIMLLDLKNEEATLAISLWGTLYNNEHAQAWREREDAEEAERLEEVEVQQAAVAEAAANSGAAPSAMTWPVVYEVNNGEATLITESGMVRARAGTVLTSGIRVKSVSATGVKATLDGNEFDLAFEESLPRPLPQNTITPVSVSPGIPGMFN